MKRRIVAVMMIMLLLCSCFAGYAEESVMRASDLIVSCSCGISSNGTSLTATASISAKDICDKIGFTSLVIQEYRNGKWITVAGKYSQYAYNKTGYATSLSYTGTSGMKYRAKCNAYVKKGDASDTASQTTSTKTLP